MKYKQEVIFILDSLLADTYFLWECFDTYKQYVKPEYNSRSRFIDALKEAHENSYIDFFTQKGYLAEPVLIPNFDLTDSVIEEFLDYKEYRPMEIRITTSDLGIEFWEKSEIVLDILKET